MIELWVLFCMVGFIGGVASSIFAEYRRKRKFKKQMEESRKRSYEHYQECMALHAEHLKKSEELRNEQRL